MISNTNIILFDIDSAEERQTIVLRSRETPVIGAVFTDERSNESEPLLANSKLYCMNVKQELFVVAENKQRPVRTEIMPWNASDNLTPIALMLMSKKEKKDQIQDLQSYFKTNRSISQLVEDMFLNVPSHVLPPIDILSKTFLQSLNNCREEETNGKDSENFKKPNDLGVEPMIVSDDDLESDNQSHTSNGDTKDREKEINNIAEDNEEVVEIDEDYSWLNQLL